MNNSSQPTLEKQIRLWGIVAKLAIVLGAISTLYYVIVGTTNSRDFVSLFVLTANPEATLQVAKSFIIFFAATLGVSLFFKAQIERKVLKQSHPGGIASINTLFWMRILFYLGCYFIGYYVYSVLVVRVDLGESTWGLVGGLSVIIYAPILVVGITLASIGAVLSKKATAQIG